MGFGGFLYVVFGFGMALFDWGFFVIIFIVLSPCVHIMLILSPGRYKFMLQKLREPLEELLSDHQPEIKLYAVLSVLLRVLYATLIIDKPYYCHLLLQILCGKCLVSPKGK